MPKSAKTKIMLCLLLSLILVLTGCGARELNDLTIVIGIGLDVDPDNPEGVLLTAQVVKPDAIKGQSSESSSSGMQGGQASAFWNIHATGKTVFDAFRECTHETHNRLYLPHNQVIVLSKEIAQSGIRRYLDAFLRHNEPRPTTVLLVSSGKAFDMLELKPELDKLPAVNLASLTQTQEFTSQSKSIDIIDYTNAMLSKTKSLVIPIITIVDEAGDKTARIQGSVGAVFKGDRMVGELNEMESRGYLWVNNGIKLTSLNIPYKNGIISVEVKRAESDIQVEYTGGKVRVKVKVKQEGAIKDNETSETLATPETQADLEKLENAFIENEILNTFKKTQAMNTDIYGFGEMVHKKYPAEWEALEDKWNEIYPTIQMEVSVISKITSAGLISKPAEPE